MPSRADYGRRLLPPPSINTATPLMHQRRAAHNDEVEAHYAADRGVVGTSSPTSSAIEVDERLSRARFRPARAATRPVPPWFHARKRRSCFSKNAEVRASRRWRADALRRRDGRDTIASGRRIALR